MEIQERKNLTNTIKNNLDMYKGGVASKEDSVDIILVMVDEYVAAMKLAVNSKD